MRTMHILVINAGSSSLKYQFFNMDNHEVLAKGICERIGFGGHMRHSVSARWYWKAMWKCPITPSPSSMF